MTDDLFTRAVEKAARAMIAANFGPDALGVIDAKHLPDIEARYRKMLALHRKDARTAIIAFLKEIRVPSADMYVAAMPFMDSYSSNTAWWQAMIDHLLSTSSKG